MNDGFHRLNRAESNLFSKCCFNLLWIHKLCTEVVLIGSVHVTVRVTDKLALNMNRHLQNEYSPSASLASDSQGTTTWVLQAPKIMHHTALEAAVHIRVLKV